MTDTTQPNELRDLDLRAAQADAIIGGSMDFRDALLTLHAITDGTSNTMMGLRSSEKRPS